MRKVIAGGFLSLVASLWILGLSWYTSQNLVTSWDGNRFFATVSELGLTLPMLLAAAVLAVGIALLFYGCFKHSGRHSFD